MEALSGAVEDSFLKSQEDRDSLIELLNKPLLDEVLEERLIRGLCCNLATCSAPQMSEDDI